ncbi:MAG TPA: hypothetical protein PKI99_03760, partial [Terrimesophilobacter sp.]|nr:hypothetical protein [Terrimesophilobacter sp.]
MKRPRSLARLVGTLTLAAASVSGIGAVVPASSPDDSIEDFIDSAMPASAATAAPQSADAQ